MAFAEVAAPIALIVSLLSLAVADKSRRSIAKAPAITIVLVKIADLHKVNREFSRLAKDSLSEFPDLDSKKAHFSRINELLFGDEETVYSLQLLLQKKKHKDLARLKDNRDNSVFYSDYPDNEELSMKEDIKSRTSEFLKATDAKYIESLESIQIDMLNKKKFLLS